MSTEYATWMADESVRNSLGELQHILDNSAGCIDELSGPKVMITDGPLEDGYVVSGVYSIEHGAKPETGLFFTSTQVENMRRAVTTLTKGPLEQALTQQRGEPFAWAMTDHQADGPMTILTTNREDAKFWGEQGIDVEPLYKSPQPSADAVREIYDAAAKGFHTSETNGAERKYLHVIRFQSIEDLHGYEDAWTAAMVKARDAK